MNNNYINNEKNQNHPSENGNVISNFFVLWITPLIKLANGRPLQLQDVYNAPTNVQTNENYLKVWKSWLNEQQLHGKDASLTRALLNGFKYDFYAGGFYLFLFMCFQLGQPYLVGELIRNVSENRDIKEGIGLAIGLGLISLCSSISFTNSVTVSRRLGVNVRSGIMMSVYSHSLNISSSTRKSAPVGQVTNLMSIDSEKLFLCAQFFHYIWYGPLSCLCVFLLLIQVIEIQTSFTGLAWIIILMILQNKVASLIGITRNRMLKHTDERVKLTNESLQSIRMIKVYGWEFPMENKILKVRSKELHQLLSYLGLNALLREVMFAAGPLAVFFIAVTTVYALHRNLTIVKVFKVLAFINILRFPLNLLAQSLKMFNDAIISIQRLQKFFSLSTQDTLPRENNDKEFILVKDATFCWNEKVELNNDNDKIQDSSNGKRIFRLENINFRSNKGELVAIIGAVGSGKSTFISSLLGEVPLWSGELKRSTGCTAYCAQQPWIQNLTLRGNVLFGLNYEDVREKYEQAIYAAALIPDFNQLPSNDLTEIGERGINLSGGQKARVSIARAFLNSMRTSTVMMDDPFSAVDGETGNWIFEKGVMECLKGKLRIITLNSHMHLLKNFDRIIILDQGKIIAEGSPKYLAQTNAELLKRVTGINDFMETNENSIGKDDIVVEVAKEKEKEVVIESVSTTKKLIQVETKAVGAVKLATFVQYFSSTLGFLNNIPSTPYYENHQKVFESFTIYDLKTITSPKFLFGFFYLAILILAFGLGQLSRLAIDFYLAKWSRDTGDSNSKWSQYYLVSIGVLFGTQLVRSSLVNITAIQSSKYIHQTILRSIFSASVGRFFDVKTTGEILNRFAKDTEAIDSSVPDYIHQVLLNWFQVFAIFSLCIWTSPWFVLILAPLSFAYSQLFKFFACVSRDLKRIESITRSPLYASFSETLSGISTVRAYNDTERFFLNHLQRMDNNQKVYYHLWMCMNWVTARLELSTSLCLLSISLLAVCLKSTVNPISLGLALSQGLQLTALLQRSVQIAIDLQTYMTSTERVIEYFTVPKEMSTSGQDTIVDNVVKKQSDYISINTRDETKTEILYHDKDMSKSSTWNKLQKLKSWPEKAIIEFNNVVMSYRDNPPVLKGVSFCFQNSERIGIAGRTGAGKSSVFVALYRIQEIVSGSIFIDGYDITKIPLQVLRKRLAIIPQDPILFSGTVRFNLDPFDEYSDENIFTVLKYCCLYDYIDSLEGKLLEEVREKGENFSQGQKQLLCIARALLLDAKILLIDEGTSACDPHTDKLIQDILKKFVIDKGMTLLTIAHRLQTIIDYDKILGERTCTDGPKRALLTGITGQDGSYLAELLLDKGYEVHGIIRRSSSFNTARIDHLYRDRHETGVRLFLHYGDLSDSTNLMHIISQVKPHEVYNLGAMSHVAVSFEMSEYTADVDGIGTLRLLNAIRSCGLTNFTRFYQASTSELYGKVREIPQTEETPFYPRSPYGVAKQYAFWIVVNYREAYNMHATNGILFNHESPRRGPTFVTRKITRAVCKISLGTQKTLFLGNLDAKRDWGHARDYVEGMWRMLQVDKPDDYVLATNITTPVRTFVEMAFKHVNISITWKGEPGSVDEIGVDTTDETRVLVRVDPKYYRPTEVDILIGNPAKAKRQLGWQPTCTVEQLCKEMVEADMADILKKGDDEAD